MKAIVFALLVILGCLEHVQRIDASIPPTNEAQMSEVTVITIPDMIERSAEKYGVSKEVMKNVIRCESHFNDHAVGDNGESFGLAQIHIPDHPEVTIAEAYDATFSIDFLAKNLLIGRGYWWSCFRQLYPAYTQSGTQ